MKTIKAVCIRPRYASQDVIIWLANVRRWRRFIKAGGKVSYRPFAQWAKSEEGRAFMEVMQDQGSYPDAYPVLAAIVFGKGRRVA